MNRPPVTVSRERLADPRPLDGRDLAPPRLALASPPGHTTSADLRARAARYQQAHPPREVRPPPADEGVPLATIPRRSKDGAAGELRLRWLEYEHRPYISVRLWEASADGQLWPTKKGVTIRLSELPAFAAGIAAALDRADAEGGAR
jgi:hypothetical protein